LANLKIKIGKCENVEMWKCGKNKKI